MRTRLAEEPTDRLVAALGGRMLSLDDFCRTRLIEVLFHLDDVAASVGVPCPDTSVEGRTIVIDTWSASPACSTATGRCSTRWPGRNAGSATCSRSSDRAPRAVRSRRGADRVSVWRWLMKSGLGGRIFATVPSLASPSST